MSTIHILRVLDAQTYRVDGPEVFNEKSKRSHCPKCRQLKDTKTFYARKAGPPEPADPNDIYDNYYCFEPRWSWACADCAEKHGWIQWQKENQK